MDMETGNNPSGTDSLSEAKADDNFLQDFYSELKGAEDEAESEADTASSQPFDSEEDASAEQPNEGSEEDATTEEDEGSDEEQPDDEQAGEQTTGPDDTTEVEVDGSKVTLGDLKQGYLRQSDYTQKTQTLANERKQFEQATKQADLHMRDEYVKHLKQAQQLVQQLVLPQEPNWNELAQEDPGLYVQLKQEWDSKKAGMDAIRNQIASTEQQNQLRETELLKQQQAEAAQELVKLHSDLVSEERQDGQTETRGQNELNSLWKYGSEIFGQDLMQSVADSRYLDVLRKAQLYDRMKTQEDQVKQKVAKKPALAKPGAARASTTATKEGEKKAKQRAWKSGKASDADDFFAQILSKQ
ncbi:hypothetical protein [Pararhizobium mangrovi]|uniref:Scaffolding protein n=1 Tax=Pararhizobium mangrovi TaxID=2590452 RepID=A0A506TXG6_9HYPH|nr:hypothetical protein [Pararhizobium mangrovi]TPW25858.1 hypothetical protein FJU11_17525 [Pararhizobium mangrovi]